MSPVRAMTRPLSTPIAASGGGKVGGGGTVEVVCWSVIRRMELGGGEEGRELWTYIGNSLRGSD